MLPVILSGGSGTRLWPLSTPEVPKQFLPLMDAKRTMIQQTVLRLDGLAFMSAPLVICNGRHLALVREQLGEIGKLRRPVMLEPLGKNTAPAIAAAALYCAENESDGLMLVLSSDSTILDVPAFQNAVALAYDAAKKNHYALFGVVPTRAETGYGYIETEAEPAGATRAVKAFKEKPDAQTAERYLAQGNHFWNGGIFAIPAKLFIKEMTRFEPEMMAQVRDAYQNAERDGQTIKLDKNAFERIQGKSVDYAVMERTKNAVVVPLDAGWSDVGLWNTVWELSHKDENGNVVNGNDTNASGNGEPADGDSANASGNCEPADGDSANAASRNIFFKDANGNLIRAENGKPIALLGIKNCIVVESKDGLLVADMKCAQEVKNAAEYFAHSQNGAGNANGANAASEKRSGK